MNMGAAGKKVCLGMRLENERGFDETLLLVVLIILASGFQMQIGLYKTKLQCISNELLYSLKFIV